MKNNLGQNRFSKRVQLIKKNTIKVILIENACGVLNNKSLQILSMYLLSVIFIFMYLSCIRDRFIFETCIL